MPIDFNKHKEAYLQEARSHIKTMNIALVELEKNPGDMKLLHKIFRSVHTLKSLAATMGYEQSMSICHAMEDLFDAIRYKQLPLESCTDLLFESIDYLNLTIKKLSAGKDENNADYLIAKLRTLLKSETKTLSESTLNQVQFDNEAIEKIQTIEIKLEQLDKLMNLAEEFIVNKMKLEGIQEQVEYPELKPAIESLGRLITELQFHVMQVRMVPILFVFNRFIRMTRDLAKHQNKKVTLQIEGGDIELDRSLIDEISEAISHLIRNAIDHGLETPEVRKTKNKPALGNIWLRVYRTKEAAKIEVSDDGSGLDLPAIKNRALKKHLIKPDATDQETLNTIFSGISTSKSVTEVSGRGLGLSIVKLKIESIGGTVNVTSNPGKGTTFMIEIPLSLAIIKTLFVQVSQQTYAVPTESVERVLMLEKTDIKGLMHNEAIIYQESNIPIIRLSHLFHQKASSLNKLPIVIISKGNERLGLVVDQLLDTKEVIIKPLNRSIRNIKYFSGATLIGSGQMILILDAAYLLQLKKKNEPLQGGLINVI